MQSPGSCVMGLWPDDGWCVMGLWPDDMWYVVDVSLMTSDVTRVEVRMVRLWVSEGCNC